MSVCPRKQSAFTIVELLVAAAITVLIVVLLGTIFGSLTGTASRANQRIDAFRDARAALQMMERDLSSVVQAHQTAYFALDKRWQPGGTDPIDPYTDQTNGNPNRQLYAIIAAKNQPAGMSASNAGDLCAVGYYCRWEGNRYTLRRYFRNSAELMADESYFANLTPSRTTPPWNIRANGPGVYMQPDKLYRPSDTDAPTSDPPTFKDDVLATHVWNLQIIAYKADGTVDPTYPLIISPTTPLVTLPAAIEISFNAMSPEGARTVMSVSTDPADWMDTTRSRYKLLIAPRAYEFRTRITL